ncbi:hypothetical protein FA15DRAFT_668052 [Coprinopsis marcescibilis]|uniref:Aminoglycoside phosphotransferase domain-containing protein n=1 Tax=Coprinopsis marcescibilis TaxID=230819 RepID=A0A5C3KZ72_COPMA|nr:hypothetical protein FA15DRAFT_668052 [Coprinopsis marcescibilis]
MFVVSRCQFRLAGVARSLVRHSHSLVIDQKEMFSVTQVRWLYNEEKQRAVRYVPFNIQALVDVGLDVADADECVSLRKISDGVSGRAFELKFDNGAELVAKIPYPTAGPKHLATASEVATMDFVRTELGLPVPIVRAWSSIPESTPVGAEYIMWDKIPGAPLSTLDQIGAALPLEQDPFTSKQVLSGMQRVESKLYNFSFSYIGSIYYKQDVPEIHRRPLSRYVTNPNMERFCIGPSVDVEFWRSGRAALPVDRGPWSTKHSCYKALLDLARSSLDIAKSDPSMHQQYSAILSNYEEILSYLADPEGQANILWHELPASAIIVDHTSTPSSFSGVVNWRNLTVLPYFIPLSEPNVYFRFPHPLIDESDPDNPRISEELDKDHDDSTGRIVQLALRNALRAKQHRDHVSKTDPKLARDIFSGRDTEDASSIQALRELSAFSEAVTHHDGEGALSALRMALFVSKGIYGRDVGPRALEEWPLPDIEKEELVKSVRELLLLRQRIQLESDMFAQIGVSAKADDGTTGRL